MVSMKDIAQRCGVSVATVSKALSGQPDIGPETRDRICAAAEEMGYVTNSAARALKANRTYNIGILFVLCFLTMVAGGGSMNLRRRSRSRRR